MDVHYIGVYKDQKAYSYWMSGFVDTVYLAKCPVNSELTFLKGNVCPSQRMMIHMKSGFALRVPRQTVGLLRLGVLA